MKIKLNCMAIVVMTENHTLIVEIPAMKTGWLLNVAFYSACGQLREVKSQNSTHDGVLMP